MKTIVTIFSMVYTFAALALIVGWVLNIWKVFKLFLAGSPLDAEFVCRLIGILVAPFGGIFGYL